MKDILEMNRDEILKLNPNLVSEKMTRQQVKHIFSQLQAFWQHDGDFSKPHVELTSGMHSNGYINCREVLVHNNLCRLMARQIVLTLQEEGYIDRENYPVNNDNWVIGSATSATDLASEVAKILSCHHGILRKGPNKEQIWENQVIQPQEKVLHIEELMTTAFTARRVRKGITQGNDYPVDFIHFIPVLIHRSSEYLVDGVPVVTIFHFNIENWDPEKYCLYCANGSKALEDPKKNWKKLNA